MYEFGAAEQQAAQRAMESGWLFRYQPEAHEADQFEAEFAAKVGIDHAMLTTSGTAALICGLSALGIGPGDEVLIPAYGFVADPLAVLAVGALPVVCEIDESLGMDPTDIDAKVTGNTKAIMPVHMNGFATELDAIAAAADRHDLVVIEDACQAIGGTYHGRRLGTVGAAGAFSFNQAKIVSAGEGGALVTASSQLRERAFLASDGSAMFDGIEFKETELFAGLAFRANEISAAIMRAQLVRLDGIIDRLRGLRDRLRASLESIGALRHIPVHDPAGSCATHVAYIFDDGATARRFMDVVNQSGARPFRGITTGIYATQGKDDGHAFTDWEIVHRRMGGHHARRNPFAGSSWAQDRDACPRSADILDRVVLVGYGLDVDETDIERVRAQVSSEFG